MGWVVGFTKLLPLVAQAINMVEKIAVGTKGKDKQEAAVATVSGIAPLLGGVDVDVLFDTKVQECLRDLIDAVVTFMNAARDARAKRPG